MKPALNPDKVVEMGEEIYQTILKKNYEGKYDNQFLAIDVIECKEYLAQYPEDALHLAEKSNPSGRFYLKRIGSDSTFHMSYTGGMDVEGVLQWV
ncbi:MAG: hypothetical protein OXE84_04205 [Rhodobacteraceae bacterium]|nr:hypothetical protein [Paracoccaceae bacterium]MCY4195687.1 hypothetical protein [Paracoccaceae bacterium]MCY4326411.1 hypothetical protein [Paracoccaceae bacterium]